MNERWREMEEQQRKRSLLSFIAFLLCCCAVVAAVLGIAAVSVFVVRSHTEAPGPRAEVVTTPVGRKTLTLVPRAGGEAELATAASILRQRLAGMGIDGKVEVSAGRLQVDLPAGDLERTVDLLLAGGRLQFKLVAALGEAEAAAELARIGSLQATRGYDERAERFDRAEVEGEGPLLLENPGVEGFLVTQVYPARDDRGQDAIGFEFGEEGRVAFRDLTGRNVGRDLAIVLDGEVQTVARIHDAVDGSGRIFREGGYQPEELKRLITVMGSGRLPIELSVEAE